MVKIKISVMLVALMVTFAIPTMAFATDEAAAVPSNNLEKNITDSGKPAVETPAVEAPVIKQPAVKTPAVEAPVTESPVVEIPAAEVPVTENPATDTQVAETPAVEQPVAEKPAAEEPVVEAPVTEQPAVDKPVNEAPAVETPAIEQPVAELPKEESTLVIHHLFQQGDVVCDDYETVDKLTAGDKVNFEKYSYEDKYEFVTCLNGKDSIELQAGTNNITIKYTLKSGFKVV